MAERGNTSALDPRNLRQGLSRSERIEIVSSSANMFRQIFSNDIRPSPLEVGKQGAQNPREEAALLCVPERLEAALSPRGVLLCDFLAFDVGRFDSTTEAVSVRSGRLATPTPRLPLLVVAGERRGRPWRVKAFRRCADSHYVPCSVQGSLSLYLYRARRMLSGSAAR